MATGDDELPPSPWSGCGFLLLAAPLLALAALLTFGLFGFGGLYGQPVALLLLGPASLLLGAAAIFIAFALRSAARKRS